MAERKIVVIDPGHPAWNLRIPDIESVSNNSDIIRGHTDTIILAHLVGKDSYGYQINKDIMQATNNQFEIKEATLYTAFRRLEQAGMIHSYWGNEDIGARRRYYTITDLGRETYQSNKQEWEHVKRIIDKLI